jgi:hypothetical protein
VSEILLTIQKKASMVTMSLEKKKKGAPADPRPQPQLRLWRRKGFRQK